MSGARKERRREYFGRWHLLRRLPHNYIFCYSVFETGERTNSFPERYPRRLGVTDNKAFKKIRLFTWFELVTFLTFLLAVQRSNGTSIIVVL